MTLRELKALEVGDEVFWKDPDGDGSGYRVVTEIVTESGLIENEDSVLVLDDKAGGQVEAFVHELL